MAPVRVLLLSVAAGLLVTACGDSTEPVACRHWSECAADEFCTDGFCGPRGSTSPDAGSKPDGGNNEPDAGSSPDGGQRPDAGQTPDAGGQDGGDTTDGGSTPDAGNTPDGGSTLVEFTETEVALGQNDTPETAQALNGLSFRLTGNLEMPDTESADTDCFSVTTTTAGVLLKVSLSVPSGHQSLAQVVVTGSEGTVTEDYLSRSLGVTETATNVTREIFLASEGTYFLRVFDLGHVFDPEGSDEYGYTVTVEQRPTPTPASLTIPSTRSIGFDNDRRLAFFKLDLVENDALVMTLSDATEAADPILWLFRPSDGALVNINDDAPGGTLDSRIERTSFFTDTLWIVADFYRAEPGDSLELSVTRGAACQDTAPPRISGFTATPASSSARFSWKTDETATTLVQVAAGNAAALGAACDATPPTAACLSANASAASCSADVCALPSDPSAFACGHEATISGLTAGTSYSWRVVARDGGARSATSPVQTFTTGTGPSLVVNEVFVSPSTTAPSPIGSAAKGEFIEIFNAGSSPVDLTGWKLTRCSDNDCTGTRDTPWPALSGQVAAGGYAVVGHTSFDATIMSVPASALVVKIASFGLRDSNADGYALLDPSGAVHSTYGAFGRKGSSHKGKSFERKVASNPDADANWADSTAAVVSASGNFATPGAKNSVSP